MKVDELDPGIRRTVLWLQENGFRTCDSGDGVSKFQCDEPMEGALDFPHVVCVVSSDMLASEADRLVELVCERGVEVVPNGRHEDGQAEIRASYDPADRSCLLVLDYVGDAELFPEEPDPHAQETP